MNINKRKVILIQMNALRRACRVLRRDQSNRCFSRNHWKDNSKNQQISKHQEKAKISRKDTWCSVAKRRSGIILQTPPDWSIRGTSRKSCGEETKQAMRRWNLTEEQCERWMENKTGNWTAVRLHCEVSIKGYGKKLLFLAS